MPPRRHDDQEYEECAQCCGVCGGIILVIGAVVFFVIAFIMLTDYNIPEIKNACTSNLENAVLVSLIYLIVVYFINQYNEHVHMNALQGIVQLIPMGLVLAVLKLSFATENLKSEICHDAITTKFDSQSSLAGHASLESLAIFYASVELLVGFIFCAYVLYLRYLDS